MKKQIPDTSTCPFGTKGPCEHLKPIACFLQEQHGINIIEEFDGKGWGTALLVDRNIPFDSILAEFDIPNFIKVDADQDRMIGCSRCWRTLAEWTRYHNNWG